MFLDECVHTLAIYLYDMEDSNINLGHCDYLYLLPLFALHFCLLTLWKFLEINIILIFV